MKMLDSRTEKLRHRGTMWAAIHDILLHEWDPIGVQDEPNAQDEYNMYIGAIWGLLDREADEEQLVKHLDDLATQRMGFTSLPEAGRPAAKSLVALWQSSALKTLH